MMSPDSSLVTVLKPSPNHGERRNGAVPSILVLHYTGMKNGAIALDRLVDPRSEVSCHYLVFEDGEIIQMVPEARRAWHAGDSIWEGQTDVNSHSIGIEIVNPGHVYGYAEFPEPQMQAVSALSHDIVIRWSIKSWRVLAHSDVAPLRKMDPGEHFDWRRLAQEGVGLWVPPCSIREGTCFSKGDAGEGVARLQQMFASYGYGIDVDASYGEETEAVVRAFQRHFRQERIDGVVDISTFETLRSLLLAKAELAVEARPFS